MEPGPERPVFKFDDGEGLTDAFGNVYEGYGGNTSSTSIVVNSTDSNPLDPEDIVDNANNFDILVFNSSTEKYEPESITFFNPVLTDGTPPTLDQIPVFDDVSGLYIPQDISYFPVPLVNGSPNDEDVLVYDNALSRFVPQAIVSFFRFIQLAMSQTVDENDILVADNNGNFKSVPQIVESAIAYNIKVPENRTYVLALGLPFDITITNTQFSFLVGPGSVSFPSGTITAGTPVDITVSGTDATSSFLRVQIDYTRELGMT
jgi:hypothetical protein